MLSNVTHSNFNFECNTERGSIASLSIALGVLLSNLYTVYTGHVRYQVKAQIVRDWKWNHRVRRLITVNGILDLNLVPKCKEPGETRNHKRLCCFCCKSGPISAVLHTKR